MARRPGWTSLASACGAACLLSSAALAQVQTEACGPGHALSPADHERIVAAIIDNAGDVVRGIDYRDLSLNNRDVMILQSALRAERIPPSVKACIEQVIAQDKGTQGVTLSPDDRERLGQVLARVAAAHSVEELGDILATERDAAMKQGAKAAAAGVEGAQRILDAGRERIYNAGFYQHIVAPFVRGDYAPVARTAALAVAERDVSGAIVGGVFGFVLGPEGAAAGAVIGGVKGSASAVLDQFAKLWFGIG